MEFIQDEEMNLGLIGFKERKINEIDIIFNIDKVKLKSHVNRIFTRIMLIPHMIFKIKPLCKVKGVDYSYKFYITIVFSL